VAVIYAIPASFSLPKEIASEPHIESWLALIGLGVICSSVAFVAFFALIREIGNSRATLVTYMNMAVAVLLGILILAEPITAGILIGFPLVLIGSYLATKKHAGVNH
jgi:drug/metabolite transporter (DMT)-like permease